MRVDAARQGAGYGRRAPAYALPCALLLICSAGFVMRLSYVDPEIHLGGDTVKYLRQAMELAIYGSLPTDVFIYNTGWSMFLSVLFSFLNPADLVGHMLVQKLAGVAMSTLTIAPIYVISRRYFSGWASLAAPAMFAAQPAIIFNSGLGLTEAPFILLVTSAIACFLSDRKRIVFLAFPIAALASIVRGEAIIMLALLYVLYAVKHRSHRISYEIPLLVLVAALILAPVSAYRIDTWGTDGMFVRVWMLANEQLDDVQGSVSSSPVRGSIDAPSTSTVFVLGQLLVLPLMLFVPYGLYRILRVDPYLAALLGMMLVITVNIMSFGGYIPRYVLWMIPVMCVLSAFGIKRLAELHRRENLALLAVMALVILASAATLEEVVDSDSVVEGYGIIASITEEIGEDAWYLIETSHLHTFVELGSDGLPVSSTGLAGTSSYHQQCPYPDSDCSDTPGLPAMTADRLRIKYWSHLIVDDYEPRNSYLLHDAFMNEDKYPYLTKVYDSRDDGFSYHVKVFEVDFEALERYP
ncbi:membrane hypothetical protein [Nitrosopumilaceae archaeon]|nr:membrane hypothetical protein [Nitrosopumilaceae archaeon]